MRLGFFTNKNKLYLLPTLYGLYEENYTEFGITFLSWGVSIIISD